MDVLNNYAINKIAEYILGVTAELPTLVYALFAEEETVTVTSVFTDFTYLVAPGYADLQLNAANWSISTVAGICNATYPQLTWTLTGPGTGSGIIYGHVVYDNVTQGILWGANWPTPFTIPANGATITISPSWQDSQCSTPSGVALPFRRASRDRAAHHRRP